MSTIERILAGEVICPGEIRHSNGRKIQAHVREHEAGRCRKRGSKGHFHPMSDPVVDGAHARTLLAEAAALCTCGDHR